jgi:6-pyruvoyltetrahydropterin/6-carboxytetrahydropterin synthase
MHEVGISARFRAQHVMPGMEGPEGLPHTHDYRLDLVLSRPDLDERGMVCDIDVLEDALESVLERVRDRDLEDIKPAEAPAVTVEVLARWAHAGIARSLRETSGDLSVRVWESPDAFGGYVAPLSSS